MLMWVVAGIELVTMIAQSICFSAGNMNPKWCAIAHTGILITFQILFVTFCVAVGPDNLARHVYALSDVPIIVGWSVSSVMVGLACV
jgi:hypothetical protein